MADTDPASLEGGDQDPRDALTAERPPGERPSETTLWIGRMSWKHFVGLLAGYAAGSLVLLVITFGWASGWWKWSFGLILLAGIGVAIRIGVAIMSTRYELSSERLFVERGLLSITRDQTELIRVDDVRVRKSLFDRIFGLGSVDVLSTDVSDQSTVITGVAGADEVAELIRSHMRTARKKSLFIENL